MSRFTEHISAVRSSAALSWLSLISRLVGAVVFGWAALSKIGDPAATARAVRAFTLLPESLVGPVAHGLPAVELVLAVLLLAGLATRIVGAVATAALAVFIAAIASAALRGLRIDCGCFGGGGTVVHTHYLLDLTRDGLLLLVLAIVPLATASRRSIDTRLHQRVIAGTVAAICLVGAAIGGNVAAAVSTNGAAMAVPAGATSSGGILVGAASAPTDLIAFEDPQCPICGQFEKINGATLEVAVAAGRVRVEYRMRSFLGPESVRADNALAAAQDEGSFEALREALYANQPEEHTGGFTTPELLQLGRSVGLDDAAFVDAVEHLTYRRWVEFVDAQASKDGDVGTPELRLDGTVLNPQQTFDNGSFRSALGLS
jgi:protein-disulfide isomerase